MTVQDRTRRRLRTALHWVVLSLALFVMGLMLNDGATAHSHHRRAYVQPDSTVPSPDDFIAHEVEPGVDYVGLQRLVVYPDSAKRYGIEGTVTVRVLISKEGMPTRVHVHEGIHRFLDSAAVQAVREARYTAAQLGGYSVASWMAIPIVFKLRGPSPVKP